MHTDGQAHAELFGGHELARQRKRNDTEQQGRQRKHAGCAELADEDLRALHRVGKQRLQGCRSRSPAVVSMASAMPPMKAPRMKKIGQHREHQYAADVIVRWIDRGRRHHQGFEDGGRKSSRQHAQGSAALGIGIENALQARYRSLGIAQHEAS